MNSSESIQINRELQAANDVIASFLKSLKNFGLYPENHTIRQKCLTNVFECLETFLNTYGSLRIDIEKEELIYQNEIIFKESAGEEKLAFFLYRDGISWIEFDKGLESKEIKGFLNILNRYRTIQEDPEGDLVTALWEEHFPNIRYKATDIYWDSEPLLELNPLSTKNEKSFGENVSKEEQENSISTTWQSSEKGLFELNADEIAQLKEMIVKEENRNILTDFLELVPIFLKNQADKMDLEAFLQVIKNEIKVALTQENFQLAHKTLKALHKIRLASKTESPWAISIFNNFIKSISDPQYLNILSKILPILDKASLKQFKLVKKFLLLLHPNVILTLSPMLSQTRSIMLQQEYLKIIEIMARRDLQPLKRLLSSNDEHMVRKLVYIAGRISSKESNRILLKMLHNPSESVRKQVIKHLISVKSFSLEIIFPFIEDPSNSIRQLILDYLSQNKPEKGEALLTEYLQRKQFYLCNNQHIIACYKTLGKCGSSKSIPFLQELLFKRRWLPDFRWAIHRQGSIIALNGLKTKEARMILQKASRSFFPNVRIAYKRGLQAIH